MALILYINSQLADLDAGQVIAQTKQVNDLNSLENRQANYTNKFNLPKTANNVRIMNFLTVPGNQSDVPYTQNSCSLYSETGECFVYNGWVVVTDGGDSYEAVVYDGIIDLYKSIENTTLASLIPSDITHDKNLMAVTNSWDESKNLPYRYILADYNGNNGQVNTSLPSVNIDYLVPSFSVSWLWNRVFNQNGFKCSGQIFNTDDFKNLWMTYPKGVPTADEGTDVFVCDTFTPYNKSVKDGRDNYWKTLIVKHTAPTTFNTNVLTNNPDGNFIKVKEPGFYKLYVSGTVNAKDPVTIFVNRDMAVATANDAKALNAQKPQEIIATKIPRGTKIEESTGVMQLTADSTLWLMMRHHDPNDAIRLEHSEKWELEVSLKKIELTSIDFGAAFADFSVRDFMQEIVQRFGLTMYKNKYSPEYEFLTLKEQIETPQVQDWSTKFSKKLNENYIYGSYAQRNWFRYVYNDKESSHNDFYIEVPNINLPDSRDVIKSKIYSPDGQTVKYLNQTGNVYRLWEKEVVEEPAEGEPPVNYKPLDKRYYFLRAQQKQQTVKLTSAQVQQGKTVSNVWVESFNRLSFKNIVQDFYQPLQQQVLKNAVIVNAELWLTDTDIINFDFRKLYHIEQLSGYFIMNKINGYVPGKVTKCEFVRVQYVAPWLDAPQINIDSVTTYPNSYNYTVYFTAKNVTLPPGENITFMASENGTDWDTVIQTPVMQSPAKIIVKNSQYRYWRITCAALRLTSNTFSY